jgi:tetratricopeptide (TPR) repeat protein
MESADDPNSNSKPAPATGWYQRTKTTLSHLWTFGTRTILLAVSVVSIVVLAIPLYSAFFDRSFVIGEFSVPDELQKKGITSGAIGRLFFDRIAEMQSVTRSAVAQSQLGSQKFGSEATTSQVTDIKLPGADVSLTALINQLRALIGPRDTRIVGEIVLIKNPPDPQYRLRAHASGGENWVESKDGPDVEALVKEIAARLVQRFDPLVAAFYYFHTPEDDESKSVSKDEPPESNLDRAINFANGFQSRDKRQQAWALVLRGLAWREKGSNPAETRASLCAAIDMDPSFIPAWRILAGSLRDDGDRDHALYLARRLVRTQPKEPEGYRQLGALRDDCMAGDDRRREGVGFFTQAIQLGKRQSEPDYLSGVDYAQFLYTWYQPVPSPKPEDFVNYMDLAKTYLKEAQERAPEEPSIYTIWARILAHPQDEMRSGPEPSISENERKARESRLLDAELKAKYAFVRDSSSAHANFTMAEVLTDQGAELRNRLLQASRQNPDEHPDEGSLGDKFKKAREILEKATSDATTPDDDAIYARALAGTGALAEAEKILNDGDDEDARRHVIQWVRGEMLYNQKRYQDALRHLQEAEKVRTCGPRSNLVHNLIASIHAELPTAHAAAAAHSATSLKQKSRAAASSRGQHKVASLPEPKPACSQWKEPEEKEPSPWPAANEMLWL